MWQAGLACKGPSLALARTLREAGVRAETQQGPGRMGLSPGVAQSGDAGTVRAEALLHAGMQAPGAAERRVARLTQPRQITEAKFWDFLVFVF